MDEKLDEVMKQYALHLTGKHRIRGGLLLETKEGNFTLTGYRENAARVDFDELVKMVLIEKGYEYQGLYLMMEPVEQGSDRVDISDYNPKNNYTSYLVRRDRYDEEGVMLDTYATLNQLCYGYLDLKYPKSPDLTDEIKKYVCVS